ncbi:MAG: DNA replication/repair protein RecF [Anaerolineae bacterium]
MYLSQLELTNFRNYAHLELALGPGMTLLHGNNAQGKTNLLEAIFYLATARSPHAGAERELIRWGASTEPIPFARVEAQVMRHNDERVRLEIILVQGVDERQNPSSRVTKRIKVNGVNKRSLDLFGQVTVVLFLPEDLDLVFGSPSARRRYLDTTLAQIDPRYNRLLAQFGQVLEQRNALLRDFRERPFDAIELETWDAKLVETGAYIIARRAQAVADYNLLVRDIHPRLTEKGERLDIAYQPTVPLDGPLPNQQLTLALGGALAPVDGVAAQFQRQLQAMRSRELGAGMTLVGPHRDDLRFFIDGVDMITYASRGQGRTIALSLKMAERELMRAETGQEPILLLDDVMSELDRTRRAALSHLIQTTSQAIVTCTDLEDFGEELLAQAHVLQVSEGEIR